MYLSPDQRYLTAELLDSSIDPSIERKQQEQSVMAGLLAVKAASKGPAGAAVTIVEFSDFECPYCRRFSDILDQVLPDQKNVRLIFHHEPLHIHPWAKSAAEAAVCAQLQSNEAFWSLHDQLFAHQTEIKADNIKEKLTDFVQQSKDIDPKEFQKCLDNQMAVGLLNQEADLAAKNKVDSTPTLFINGRRLTGVRDAAQLRDYVKRAQEEAKQPDTENTSAKPGGSY